MRDEGAGDVIMSVPTVRALKRRLPDATITYATRPIYMELLHGIDCIDNVKSVHDIDLTQCGEWDLVINWCRALEHYGTPRNRGPRIDSFARHIGILDELEHDRQLELNIQTEHYNAAFELVGHRSRGERMIAFVVSAAAWNRTWPTWKLHELIGLMAEQMPGTQLVLIDREPELNRLFNKYDNVISVCGMTKSFMEAAAVVSFCDAVITPDTGLSHAAAALGKPTLVLCGSIPPEMRFSYYDDFECLYPVDAVECCPCWDWQERWTRDQRRADPKRGIYRTCRYEGLPRCMHAIEPAEIVKKIKSIM